MKIAIKTQTARSTHYKEDFNNVNLFLGNFQVGLQVTGWGETKTVKPIINFQINGKKYEMLLSDFVKKAELILTKDLQVPLRVEDL